MANVISTQLGGMLVGHILRKGNPFEDGSKPFTAHITFGNVESKGFAQPQALQGAIEH